MQMLRMANIRDFLRQSGSTQAKLADELGISRGYMSELVAGSKIPSLGVAVAIERATGGAIPASSWVPLDEAPLPVPTPTPEEDAA